MHVNGNYAHYLTIARTPTFELKKKKTLTVYIRVQ